MKEMEKKLSETRGHFLPSAVPSLDGMYSVVNQSLVEKEYDLDQCLSKTFCDDMSPSLSDKRRGKRSVTSRLYKSFRDRYSVKHRLNKSYLDHPDRHNNNSILEASTLNRSTYENYGSLNRSIRPLENPSLLMPMLKPSSSSGSTKSATSSISSASSGYLSLPSPTRASWQSYHDEKIRQESVQKLNVESRV
jgi:hypothetical protein